MIYIDTENGLINGSRRERNILVPHRTGHGQTWPLGYKTFFMLISVENEILNARKYINIKKFVFF